MLLRMEMRWAERRGFEVELLEASPGEEAGIKSATFLVKGENAYGLFGAEKGVHRLVRLSPFDAAHRRQTSFAGVEVSPVVEDIGDVEIDDDDLQIDTYRASGAGGQHVNKTDSAVRITHKPSGIVVQCQNERSQSSNKAEAMTMLRSKLLELEERKRREEIAKEKGEAQDVNFGSQIRSYVLHPYSMVKDHRTDTRWATPRGCSTATSTGSPAPTCSRPPSDRWGSGPRPRRGRRRRRRDDGGDRALGRRGRALDLPEGPGRYLRARRGRARRSARWTRTWWSSGSSRRVCGARAGRCCALEGSARGDPDRRAHGVELPPAAVRGGDDGRAVRRGGRRHRRHDPRHAQDDARPARAREGGGRRRRRHQPPRRPVRRDPDQGEPRGARRRGRRGGPARRGSVPRSAARGRMPDAGRGRRGACRGRPGFCCSTT